MTFSIAFALSSHFSGKTHAFAFLSLSIRLSSVGSLSSTHALMQTLSFLPPHLQLSSSSSSLIHVPLLVYIFTLPTVVRAWSALNTPTTFHPVHCYNLVTLCLINMRSLHVPHSFLLSFDGDARFRGVVWLNGVGTRFGLLENMRRARRFHVQQ